MNHSLPFYPLRSALAALCGLAACPLGCLFADQLPAPTVTASATPFNGSYVAANLFDASASSEYASQGKVACSAPLVNDGTYVELDFGSVVTFDQFILVTRNNTADNVLSNRLYVGNSPTHSLSDTMLSFGTAGNNGQGIIQRFIPVTGRYVRWEVLRGPATGNLGGNQMYFLNSPAGTAPLPAPTVISSSPPFNANYVASRAADGFAGCNNNDGAYASLGAGAGMFIDFDFGVPTAISGWDFLNRQADVVTAYQMIFANVSDFSTGSITNSYSANASGLIWNTVTLAPITARYVRLQATANTGANTGVREIQFYGSASASIGRQPQDGTNYVWGIHSFSVSAGGALPLSYQWYRSGSPATAIPGATSATYTIDPVTNTSAGGYFVVVSNPISSATSTVATLTVLAPTPDYTSALAAYYTFDESSGQVAADSSGNGINATLSNFPFDDSMWVTGRVGGALQFNATDASNDDTVLTDSALNLANEDLFTFAFWAKRRSDNNPFNPRIIGPVSPVDGQYWVVWAPALGGIGFYPPVASPVPIRDVWQHFVITYDRLAGKYETYVDGRKKAEATSSGYLKTSPAGRQWAIGCKEILGDYRDPWRGYLDDVRVYNRILLPGDVKALFEVAGSVAPTFDTQPVGSDLFVGDTLKLYAAVDGTPPVAYQWYRNRTNLLVGATELSLTITNVQTSHAGDYTMVAVNALKAATSAVAHVTVTPITGVATGLGGYWKFDETSGTAAADSSGKGSHGTVNNFFFDSGQWTAGQVGGALQFRGSVLGGDYVVVPAWPKARNGTMSMSAWVWADARPTWASILCGGSGVDGVGQFSVNLYSTSGDLVGYVESSARAQLGVREGVLLPTNQWQHVAMVADGSLVRLYRNGVQVGTVAYDGTLFNPTHALSLGATLGTDDTGPDPVDPGYWEGKLDDAAYWTRSLTAGEVFALFAAGLAGQPVTAADSYLNSAPIITSQPQAVSVYLHEPFTLSVTAASQTPPTYQWRKAGLPIATATNRTFTDPSAELSDAGAYSVVITANSLSVTSAPATVTVLAPAPQPDSGMVMHLKLDETSGWTAADATTNANDGSLLNFVDANASWLPGIIKGALNFSQGAPAADAVLVPDFGNLEFGPNPFSLSLWAKGPTAQVASGGLLCKGTGGQEAYCVDVFGGVYRFFVRNSTGQTAANLTISSGIAPNNQWQHLAVIYDPAVGQSRMYVNGSLVGTGLTADATYATGASLDIGARQATGGGFIYPWQGLLDDVRVYGRAITPLEVRALTYQGIPPGLTINSSAGAVTLSWPLEALDYELVSRADLSSGAWTQVPGVTGNTITLPASGATKFFRLRLK